MEMETTVASVDSNSRLDLDHAFHQNIIQHLLKEKEHFEYEKNQLKEEERLRQEAIKERKEKKNSKVTKPALAIYTVPAKRSATGDMPQSRSRSSSFSLPDCQSQDPQQSTRHKKCIKKSVYDLENDVITLSVASKSDLLKSAIKDPSSLNLRDIFHVGHNIVHAACSDIHSIPGIVALYSLIYKREVQSGGLRCAKYRISLSVCSVITTEYSHFQLSTIFVFLQNVMSATLAIKKEPIVSEQISRAILHIIKKANKTNIIPDICSVLLICGPQINVDCPQKLVKRVTALRKLSQESQDWYTKELVEHVVEVCENWKTEGCERSS